MSDLPMEAMKLADDLAEGHYGMTDATAMIRKLALALDDASRAARITARAAALANPVGR